MNRDEYISVRILKTDKDKVNELSKVTTQWSFFNQLLNTIDKVTYNQDGTLKFHFKEQ